MRQVTPGITKPLLAIVFATSIGTAEAQTAPQTKSWQFAYGFTLGTEKRWVVISNESPQALDVTPVFTDGVPGRAKLEIVCSDRELTAALWIKPISQTVGFQQGTIDIEVDRKVVRATNWSARWIGGGGVIAAEDPETLVRLLSQSGDFVLRARTNIKEWSISFRNSGFVSAFAELERACRHGRS